MTVAAVIPNWNGAALLAQVLRSLKEQGQLIDEVIVEAIVVDNGSTDQSIAVAERAGARVIALQSNTGFARAVNRGIESASSEWILILNNDVELRSNWLAPLLAEAEATGAWFATGKLLDAAGTLIDGTFDAISRGACAWRCGAGSADSAVWSQTRSIRFAPFTAALFRSELFRRVGLLDEDYESYLEDIDFGLRCALAGLAGIYVPAAVAIHQGSATLGRWHAATVRRISRNQLFLVAKHYPAHWVLRHGWHVLIGQGLWGLLALRHGTGAAYLQGKFEGLRKFQTMRRMGTAAVSTILKQSEREIFDLQHRTAFDNYWKAYFALTGKPADG